MILIGENIHIISKSVQNALIERNEEFILNLIKMQSCMDYVDLNVGPAKKELENILAWLAKLVENNSNLKISFDTTNVNEMKNGLAILKNPDGSFLNSTNNDTERLEKMTDLALEYDCNLIALTLSKDSGIPKTGRLEIAFEIYERCLEKGLDNDKIFFDPLVLPISIDQSQAIEVIDTIRMIKESFDPPVKTVIGLSNISNGSPPGLRPLINRVFGVLAYGAGLDAAIINAEDSELIRIFKMLDSNSPNSKVDELYMSLVQMIENFTEFNEIKFDKNDPKQLDIIKTAEILLNKKVYSNSFTQI